MSRPVHAFYALILILFALDGIAQVPATPYETPFTILQQEVVYDMRTDGTYMQDTFTSVRINNQQGVQASGQVKRPYSTTLQELEVLATKGVSFTLISN